MKELPKAYEPKQYEDKIYRRWEESGFFNPDVCIEEGKTAADAPPFSIVLPPPNVTGTLHIGHAVMLAIEDIMVRYHRMRGDRTLWVPGTDHAAIATQEKVERILWDTEKKTRHDLGREPFLEKVNQFAADSHDRIVNQAKKMGTSMDWSREYYSLDDARNLAVRTAFKTMYDGGLIYRGDRIVNWDPKMQSNVSDIEVDRKEEKAPFYYFQYGPFVIGTARPETKFGDKYVVMHPDDERYAAYKHGDTFECEWINGPITATIIKDEAVDPEFGTGVMTITPWHDATDFHMAEKHGLDKEQVIDLNGNLMGIAGEFAGMNILDARPKIVQRLEEKGLLVRVDEEYLNSKATNSRGGGLIEPQIMKQWWLDVNKEFAMKGSKIDGIQDGEIVTIKKILQHVVRSKNIEIVPERFEKTYFHWIDNLQDWCLSRQIWFGHQVPAWYRVHPDSKGEEVFVGLEAPEEDGWVQDSDTLDTWFSAGLFSFSPLGWPGFAHATPGKPGVDHDFANYHPTSVLETGYDILFFWVARMILMSTYLVGEIPFKTVYLHGLVRDEQGRKMSKSLDNIIDPLDVSEKFGTDAVRLSLVIGASAGNDSKLSEEKIGGFRNFANKLWNISRFTLLNIENPQVDAVMPEPKTLADAWILARMDVVVAEVTHLIDEYQFSPAGELLRDFTWNELADWYLEIAKIEGEKSAVLNYLLNTVLTLWHPFMPFVTEAIWQEVYGEEEMLMVTSWPQVRGDASSEDALSSFAIIQKIVTGIRSLRSSYGIAPVKEVTVYMTESEVVSANKEIVMKLARLAEIKDLAQKPEQAVGFVESGIEMFVDLAGSIDIGAERTRLQKEIDHVTPFIAMLEKKLSNKAFALNAPAEVVAQEEAKLAEAKEKVELLQEQLSQLAA